MSCFGVKTIFKITKKNFIDKSENFVISGSFVTMSNEKVRSVLLLITKVAIKFFNYSVCNKPYKPVLHDPYQN